MRAFLSYSRRDERAVTAIVDDLRRARHSTWRDEALGGGEDWWLEILEQIRGCDVFLFVLSTHSVRSRPCLAELEYANALGLPVLPVQIGPVESLRMTPIAEKQVVDYRPRLAMTAAEVGRAESLVEFVVATSDLAGRRRPLPSPLPPEPSIPYEYLMQISIALDAAELPGRAQLQILTQLKQALRDEEDAGARRDVLELLQRLRRHPETTYRNAVEIDELLAARGEAAPVTEAEADTVVDPPEPEVVSPPPQPAPAAERSFPPWSVAGSALGLVGIAQIGPLLFYTMSFLVDADPSVPGYAFQPRPFLTTMTVIAVLCGLGVGAAVRARVVGEQGARQALLLSVVGLAVVVGVLLRYAGATG